MLKQFPDLVHVSLGQLGSSAPLSASRCTVPISVRHVLGAGSPAQIIKPVVGGIAIKMSALASGRTRANKSFENKPVNEHLSDASFGAEPDTQMSIAADDARSEHALASSVMVMMAFHTPQIGDGVEPLIPNYRNPTFSFDVDFGNNTGRIHDAFFLWDARNLGRGSRATTFVRDAVTAVNNNPIDWNYAYGTQGSCRPRMRICARDS